MKRIKPDPVGDRISTTPHVPVDTTSHSSSNRNGRERKRRLSDDLVTPIMSGTSTPGRHSASPSRSVVSVSTPSSSVPAASVSPIATHGSEEHDRHLKRPRVYDVEEDTDNDGPVTDEHRQNGPIVIDDEDEDGDVASDGNSNQADYDNSFSCDTSFSGQDDSSLNHPLQVEDDSEFREPSPAHSVDSDATVTPSRLRTTANGSAAQVRAPSAEQQAEPATSPRQNLSRSHSSEPQSIVSQAPTVHTIEDDPDNEEVIEIIDLTPQPRISTYPRGDSLHRVPGLTPQHSFQLPTLQRLVSRSSQSMERSQTRPTLRSPDNSIDILEIPDDNDGDDDDFYGRDTVRIDSEVREVQLDPHHPWSRGPIQLILSTEDRLETEGYQRPQIEDVVDVDDHLPAIDYAEIESDSDEEDPRGSQEVEDDGVNERQVDEEVNYILSLRRDSTSGRVVSRRTTPHLPPPRSARQGSFPARSPPSFMRSSSYEAQPITFPTTSRRSTTPLTREEHRYLPVARRPSPVRLILRDPALPFSSSSSSSSSSARPSSRRAPSFSPDMSSQRRRLLRQGSEQREDLLIRDSGFASSQGRSPNHNQLTGATKATVMTTTTTTQRRQSTSVGLNAGSWMSQHLKCSICMETMNVPTMLRCGHAFCRACIHMALNVARHCPMCRQPTARTRLQELEFHVGGGSSRPVGTAID